MKNALYTAQKLICTVCIFNLLNGFSQPYKAKVSANTHQIGFNTLCFSNSKIDEPFGEGVYQKSILSYRFLNTSNFNPFISFGYGGSNKQTVADKNNGTVDKTSISNIHLEVGVDHRFLYWTRFSIYGGMGMVYLKHNSVSSSRFNTGSAIQETTSTTKNERNGIFFSAAFEYGLNAHWKIATRFEFRKMIETNSTVFNNNFYPNLRTEQKTDLVRETGLWPFQLILQYNII